MNRTAAAPLADVLNGPNLPNAACTGRHPLFDLDYEGETTEQREARHNMAASLCVCCPELLRCAAQLSSLPHGTSGVYAAMLLDGRHAPRPIRTQGRRDHQDRGARTAKV